MADILDIRSDPSSDPESTTTPDQTSSDLQFPRLPVDDRIRLWAQDTSHSTGVSASNTPTLSRRPSYETMSAPSEARSDENSLAESSYEFIDTDGESRDGNATESMASTDFGRPDEVASLADSGDESGEDDDDESTYLEEASPVPEDASVVCSTVMLEDIDRPVVQAIEFEEPFTLGGDTISVKHTVADYSEEQSISVIKDMELKIVPTRLTVTIRQTMTKQGLSTRDPLRILYVGSHAAKQDIIHKVASSVTASVDSGKHRQYPSQLYNVVPVSAFGSEKTPEIELMHSSGYQIKVEDGVAARNLKFEDSPEKPDVIKLTLDDNYSYHSVPEGEGFIIEPAWELPHVAIFYCSANDDAEARKTMTMARKFMGRHSVPSIVISHKQLFDRGQCMSLDQHAIHMCLESREPNARWSLVHRRLPIDLASFLNIDARQMNRNLAYMTGLHEPFDTPTPSASVAESQDLEKTPYNMSSSFNFIRRRTGAEWRAFVPVGVLLISVFAAVFTGIPTYKFYSTPAISINSKVMSAVPISTRPPTSTLQVPNVESTFTHIEAETATRTITVTQSPSLQTSSLDVVPSKELGDLASAVHGSSKPTNKSFVCSAQVLGDREILIRIPSATKLSWLTKEAMSVNITRGNATVDTERAYSSDEGIVLLLPKEQAYGVLNISIITTKKPRVNETFQVDFGTSISQKLQGAMDKVSSFFTEDPAMKGKLVYENVLSMMDKVLSDTQGRSQSTMAQMEEAGKIAMEHTTNTSARLARFVKGISLSVIKQSAIISKEATIQYAEMEAKLSEKVKALERWREPVGNRFVKAQVQARLLWLKLRGDEEGCRKYRQRAADFAELDRKVRDMRDLQEIRLEELKKNIQQRRMG